MFSCISVKHEETWDEDNVNTVNVFRLETVPVEKEPGYMLAEENKAVYKKDESYTPDREFEEPLPGEDDEPEASVSAAKIALYKKSMIYSVKSFQVLVSMLAKSIHIIKWRTSYRQFKQKMTSAPYVIRSLRMGQM